MVFHHLLSAYHGQQGETPLTRPLTAAAISVMHGISFLILHSKANRSSLAPGFVPCFVQGRNGRCVDILVCVWWQIMRVEYARKVNRYCCLVWSRVTFIANWLGMILYLMDAELRNFTPPIKIIVHKDGKLSPTTKRNKVSKSWHQSWIENSPMGRLGIKIWIMKEKPFMFSWYFSALIKLSSFLPLLIFLLSF